MLPIPTPSGHYWFKYGQRGLAVFLNSKGEMTAYGPKGNIKWQISTEAQWSKFPKNHRSYTEATLEPLALRIHALPTTVLASGIRKFIVVSENGHILHTSNLPEPPAMPLIIHDFNGDGLNDIIVVGKHKIYGFVQVTII